MGGNMSPFFMKTIILIGFMGAGKTHFGSRLASYYKCKFADLDNLIERSEKLSIRDIFKDYGEKYFRQIESDILQNWNLGGVLATGGGIIEFSQNREFLKNCSADVIWLNPNFETIYNKIKNSHRPLVLSNNYETLRQLWKKRLPLYKKCADYIIDDIDFEKIVDVFELGR